MLDARAASGFERSFERYSVNGSELVGFPRRRMRCADQVNHRMCAANGLAEAARVERIANDDLAAERQLRVRSWPYQGANVMASRDQIAGECPADVARGPGNENGAVHAYFYA
jgi:hypothetical protein